MKSNYKLKLITALVVLGFSVANANALLPTLTPTTISAENSDEWVMVQNENGIKVYFSEYKLEEKSYLKIRFENTIVPIIKFTWSLQKNSKTINSESTIVSTKVSEKFDSNNLITINNGESFKDFHVTINLK